MPDLAELGGGAGQLGCALGSMALAVAGVAHSGANAWRLAGVAYCVATFRLGVRLEFSEDAV